MVLKSLLRNFSDAKVARGGINISTKGDLRPDSPPESPSNIWRQTPYREVVIPKSYVMHNSADHFPLQLNAIQKPKEQHHAKEDLLTLQDSGDEDKSMMHDDFLPLRMPDKEDDSYLAHFVEHLRETAHAQSQLNEDRKFKGGWEGWAETEMAIALQRKYEGQTKIWSNQAVYQECPWASQSKQVDLWVDIEPRDARNGIAWFGGIEMKCENASMRKSAAATATFSSQVMSDIQTIKQGIKAELYPTWEKHACASKYPRGRLESQMSKERPVNGRRDARWAWQNDKDTWLQSFENQLYEGSGLWGKKSGTVMYAIGITGYPDSLLRDHWGGIDVGYCPLDRVSSDAILRKDFARWKRFDESRIGRQGDVPDEDFEWNHVYLVWWKKTFLDGSSHIDEKSARADPEYEIEKRLEVWERVKKSICEIIPEDHLSVFSRPFAALKPVRDYLRPETTEELELIDRLTFAARLADQVTDNLFIFSLYSLVPLTAAAACDRLDEEEDDFRPRLKW